MMAPLNPASAGSFSLRCAWCGKEFQCCRYNGKYCSRLCVYATRVDRYRNDPALRKRRLDADRAARAEKCANDEAYREARLESVRAYRRSGRGGSRKKTGFSVALVAALKEKQKGACAICSASFMKEPHADHCHASNTPRGLLCGGCNRALGFFKDNPAALAKAIEYLANPPASDPFL